MFFPGLTYGIPLLNIVVPFSLLIIVIVWARSVLNLFYALSPIFFYCFLQLFNESYANIDFFYEVFFLSKICVSVAVFIHLKEKAVFISSSMNLFIEVLIISVLAISLAQIFLSPVLSENWYKLPYNLEVDYTRYYRQYNSLSLVRPNGLVGNPIELGSFMEISIIYFSKVSIRRRAIRDLYKALSFIIVLATLSRVNSLLAIVFLLYDMPTKRLMQIVPIALIVVYSSTIITSYFGMLTERYSGDKLASQSTVEHISDYADAIENILQSPIFGHSITLVRNRNIITDGAVFHITLVYGVIGVLLLFNRLFYSVRPLYLLIFILLSLANSALLSTVNIIFVS